MGGSGGSATKKNELKWQSLENQQRAVLEIKLKIGELLWLIFDMKQEPNSMIHNVSEWKIYLKANFLPSNIEFI